MQCRRREPARYRVPIVGLTPLNGIDSTASPPTATNISNPANPSALGAVKGR